MHMRTRTHTPGAAERAAEEGLKSPALFPALPLNPGPQLERGWLGQMILRVLPALWSRPGCINGVPLGACFPCPNPRFSRALPVCPRASLIVINLGTQTWGGDRAARALGLHDPAAEAVIQLSCGREVTCEAPRASRAAGGASSNLLFPLFLPSVQFVPFICLAH